MARLAVNTLGGIEIYFEDRPVTALFRTRKEVLLLVYLMAESHHSHTREFLAELFWPEKPEGVARVNLRQALAGIKKIIGDRQAANPYLITTHETILFNQQSDYWLDEQAFKDHFQSVQAHTHDSLVTCQPCIQQLLAANAIYGGDYLYASQLSNSLDLNEWIFCRREQYFRLMLGALKNISDFFNHLGDHETAIRFARQLVNLDPLEEGEHQNLIYLLAVSGHRSAALEQYQQCQQMLKSKLGIEPSDSTTTLYERIRSGQISEATKTGHLPTSLPIELTSFINRQAEIEEFQRCFQNPVCRLLTLVGPPGIGKTRLALHIFEDHQDDYPDGAYFIPLDSTQPGETLAACLASATGLKLDGPPTTFLNQLINHLQWNNTLILLDHFDDFMDETGVLIKLLSRARQLRVLLTSRERLNLQSACLFRLGGLPCIPVEPPFQPQESDAVQLFLQRARRIRTAFNPDEASLAHVIRICHLAEGNPLAIELAAARLHDLSLEQIASRLQQGIDVLATSADDLPEHQRSMRISLDYSWERLDLSERETLAKLSSLIGGFSFEEAQFKLGVQPSTLTSLFNKSLVEKGSEDKYSLPNLVRMYATEKLAVLYPDFYETLDQTKTQPLLVLPLQTSRAADGVLTHQHLLENRLEYILKRACRNQSLVAVMVHDINLLDSAPPAQAGELQESILMDVKVQVESSLREYDSIFSSGLSELTIVIEDLKSKKDALTVAQKLLKDTNAVIAKRHREILALINLGISLYPHDGQDPQVLLDKAHQALSLARKYGDCIRFFSDE
jgi:DNA-binding SARP family transcriptional activator/GGDEF domain-containing protein